MNLFNHKIKRKKHKHYQITYNSMPNVMRYEASEYDKCGNCT